LNYAGGESRKGLKEQKIISLCLRNGNKLSLECYMIPGSWVENDIHFWSDIYIFDFLQHEVSSTCYIKGESQG